MGYRLYAAQLSRFARRGATGGGTISVADVLAFIGKVVTVDETVEPHFSDEPQAFLAARRAGLGADAVTQVANAGER